jgi:hypothetical protein
MAAFLTVFHPRRHRATNAIIKSAVAAPVLLGSALPATAEDIHFHAVE